MWWCWRCRAAVCPSRTKSPARSERRSTSLSFASLVSPVTKSSQWAPSRLERAIGVIYRPGTEPASHYFQARLSDQFDAVLHFDETRAVEPLEYTAEWEAGELPETFPFAV
jgi:erythromycin esterase-like protein